MPRPLLRTQDVNDIKINITATPVQDNFQFTKQKDKLKLDRLLRTARSKTYMEALHKLDAGGHVHNKDKIDEIIKVIQDEFPEVEIEEIFSEFIGYVSKCYLGKPYEVHTLTVTGAIIEHYKSGNPLPDGLEKARTIAKRGGYEFIEVYTDCCRAISSNGSVSVIY
jgi:hypothetical protein